jgi:NAD+ diphosphatase
MFVFSGDSLVVPAGVAGNIFIISDEQWAQLAATASPIDQFTAPPVFDDAPLNAAVLPKDAALPEGWERRQVRSLVACPAVERLLRAYHLAQWRRESRFCGSCGHENIDSDKEYARLCPACGRLEFPRISPAIITLVTNERGEILLAHNKNFKNGVYSLIAGFVEAGETLEAAVRREVREETSINIEDIQYAASQPWPFPNSLMLGFTARWVSGTVQADGVELEDAGWFHPDALPPLPAPGSVARKLINRWLGVS